MASAPGLERRKRIIGRPPMPRGGSLQRATLYMRENATRRISTSELCAVTLQVRWDRRAIAKKRAEATPLLWHI
jgi:hypothetical protein